MTKGDPITIRWDTATNPEMRVPVGSRPVPFTLRFGGGAYDVLIDVESFEPGCIVGRIASEPVARN